MGHNHDCDKCNGIGSVWPVVELKAVPIGHVMLNPLWAAMLRAMHVDVKPDVPCGFIGDGFEGLVTVLTGETLTKGRVPVSTSWINQVHAFAAAIAAIQ